MPTHDPDFDQPEKPAKAGRCQDAEAALSCHFWGVIAIFTWWVPLLGQVAVAAALVRGYQGWSSGNRLNARIGVVLAIVALGVMLLVFGWFVCVVQAAGGI
jgi:hypothetical protein